MQQASRPTRILATTLCLLIGFAAGILDHLRHNLFPFLIGMVVVGLMCSALRKHPLIGIWQYMLATTITAFVVNYG